MRGGQLVEALHHLGDLGLGRRAGLLGVLPGLLDLRGPGLGGALGGVGLVDLLLQREDGGGLVLREVGAVGEAFRGAAGAEDDVGAAAM